MSSHNPKAQIGSVDKKLTAVLHKIGEVYKYLLLQVGKEFNLSPIQIQILLFIAHHEKTEYRTVSYLSQELNITKPTVSDAVKVLFKKNFIVKNTNQDTRSYSINLSEKGKSLLPKLENFDDQVLNSVKPIDHEVKADLLQHLLLTLSRLQEAGVVNQQRMCFNCIHLHKDGASLYCKLLKKALSKPDLRVDCPEFEEI